MRSIPKNQTSNKDGKNECEKRSRYIAIRKQKIRAKCIISAITLILSLLSPIITLPANADNCPKLRIVFARGSGAPMEGDKNYQDFVGWIDPKLIMSNFSESDYEFINLDYPAIGMNVDNIWAVIGTFLGAGDKYEFGESVNTGVKNLITMVNDTCPNTKYVLAGYSQGAMVISKAIHSISPDKIIYAATFGDPKLYLPEGQATGSWNLINSSNKNVLHTGSLPAACKGENLSDYRRYVPDCYAYEGMLGGYKPYAPIGYEGKLGTWCKGGDIFCSSYLSLDDHLSYATDSLETDLYRDASKIIATKIMKAFPAAAPETTHYSDHDVAILVDTTYSMQKVAPEVKEKALVLAKSTLENGGRVALYEYRDLKDKFFFWPLKKCSFVDCTIEKVEEGLESMTWQGGSDTPEESLLWSSYYAMQELEWKIGAVKSLVIFTDSGYHSPDLNNTTLYDVASISRRIDPVNFYISTMPETAPKYADLAAATDGMVASTDAEYYAMIEHLLSRTDALPHVEQLDQYDETSFLVDEDVVLPEIIITKATKNDDSSFTATFSNTGTKALVSLNDTIVGSTTDTEITVTDLDYTKSNYLTLTPISSTRRGRSTQVIINEVSKPTTNTTSLGQANLPTSHASSTTSSTSPVYISTYSISDSKQTKVVIPKVPNTGRLFPK